VSAPTLGAAGAQAAARAVRGRLGERTPVAAIVLGTGLDRLADRIEGAVRLPYADVPGFASPSVVGHRGEIVGGRLAGREVIALAGRLHLYEGHSPRAAAFPVRVVHALGARVLLISNAAGGIRRPLRAGDLMIIEDQINLTWHSPLVGALEPGDERFPDMSSPYAPRLLTLLREAARAAGVPVTAGVYAGLLGPSYETPAEVRMLERLGADAVGMSTVAETIVARALRMEVAGVSLITNEAAGLSGAALSHEEVVATAAGAAEKLEEVVMRFVALL